ncbi:MAG: chemotaxis protein CheX [Methylococcales bacterium]|nr:chemotaxis protein CheX [Methylococcales bacterium]
MPARKLIAKVMQSVMTRTHAYFESEFDIKLTEHSCAHGRFENMTLLDTTAVIHVGGLINLLIAFSFESSLLNVIFEKMTEELEVELHEIGIYREAAASDVINTIVGHCTIDLLHIDKNGVAITSPTILDSNHAKKASHIKDAMFYTVSLNTALGKMNISLVAQPEMLENNFNE